MSTRENIRLIVRAPLIHRIDDSINSLNVNANDT